jgi:hypothetical protein
MSASAEGGSFELGLGGKPQVKMDKKSLAYYNDGGAVISVFGSKDRTKGYMELNDASGTKMVEAGSLNTRQGYVLASPYRSSVDPRGNPSVLQGGAGR